MENFSFLMMQSVNLHHLQYKILELNDFEENFETFM